MENNVHENFDGTNKSAKTQLQFDEENKVASLKKAIQEGIDADSPVISIP